MPRRVFRASFRAMSTDIDLVAVGVGQATVDAAARHAQDVADAWEQTFSRFRRTSELSRLNDARGRPLAVSNTFIAVLDLAVAATRLTGGRFDPTVLPALEAVGYDRDIAQVRRRPGWTQTPVSTGGGGVDRIEIDRERATVHLPEGMRLDFGGIAKGAFVDLLADEFIDWPGGSVDAGGDLRCWGTPPSGSWWMVGLEAPDQPGTDRIVAEVRRPSAAVATSGTQRRRWRTDNGEANHLIDPLTGRSLGCPMLTATVFAATTTQAEIATKSLMVAAARGGPLQAVSSWCAVVMRIGGEVEFVSGSDDAACTFFAAD